MRLILTFIATSIFCLPSLLSQKMTAGLKTGMLISKIVNNEEFQWTAYDINPLISKNIGINTFYQYNEKLEIGIELDYLTTGYERWFLQGGIPEEETPIHHFSRNKFHYIGTGLSGRMNLTKKNSIRLGAKSLFIFEKFEVYNLMTEIYEIEGDERELIRSYSNNWDDGKSNFDLILELGFMHRIWKGFYAEIFYFRGLRPIRTNLSGLSIYNQSISLSIGYDIPLSKK